MKKHFALALLAASALLSPARSFAQSTTPTEKEAPIQLSQFEVNATAERDNNSWEVDLTVSYPWGRISDKARYRQSLGVLNQQRLTVRQLEQNILVQVRSAVRAVETNSEKVKIVALAAEFSARQYDLENARFSAGLATSRDVLQTQSDWQNARVAELQARITLQNSISALHRLEGSSLERYHITVPE